MNVGLTKENLLLMLYLSMVKMPVLWYGVIIIMRYWETTSYSNHLWLILTSDSSHINITPGMNIIPICEAMLMISSLLKKTLQSTWTCWIVSTW